ncbi:Nucleoside diphosphate kinase [Candidatus Norongarragalina meridionalis]|nr:Nucleoside diphosphate kinase [Candidatus Norongarragalina meridionalis]
MKPKPVEHAIVLIKPGYSNRLKEIRSRLEKHGKILLEGKVRLSPKEAEEFYVIHDGKPFQQTLVDYMVSGEVPFLIVSNKPGKKYNDASFRQWMREHIIGATDPIEAAPGTIRYDMGDRTPDVEDKIKNKEIKKKRMQNVVHFTAADEDPYYEIGVILRASGWFDALPEQAKRKEDLRILLAKLTPKK